MRPTRNPGDTMIGIDLNPKRPEIVRVEDLKPTDAIGFVDSWGKKGYLVHLGEGVLSAICADNTDSRPLGANSVYGSFGTNQSESVRRALDICSRCLMHVKTAYKFESLKALHRWLGEE